MTRYHRGKNKNKKQKAAFQTWSEAREPLDKGRASPRDKEGSEQVTAEAVVPPARSHIQLYTLTRMLVRASEVGR